MCSECQYLPAMSANSLRLSEPASLLSDCNPNPNQAHHHQSDPAPVIQDVWAHNLGECLLSAALSAATFVCPPEEEFAKIRQVVEHYPYIAMVSSYSPAGWSLPDSLSLRSQDTEFPGIVAKPTGIVGGDYGYQLVKVNVDLLKVVQLGITFANSSGQMPEGTSTWQFNFKFDLRYGSAPGWLK